MLNRPKRKYCAMNVYRRKADKLMHHYLIELIGLIHGLAAVTFKPVLPISGYSLKEVTVRPEHGCKK